MGVLDGQAVNAAVTNPAFINKNIDDTMSNKLGFNRALSGSSIADIQSAVNKLYTATGASESQSGTVYNATPNTISNGDPYQTALAKLSFKFAGATGHTHDGTDGNGPLLSVARSIAASGYTPLTGDILIAGINGAQVFEAGNTIYVAATGHVDSIAASGYSALQGAVTLAPSGGTILSSSGQEIDIYSPPLTSSAPQSVGSSNTVGTSIQTARADHVHQGVHSIAATGNSQIYGDFILIPGSGVSLAQAGQNITISTSGGGGGGGSNGPISTPNASSGSVGISSGYSLFWPYLDIISTDTITVSSGAELVGVTTLTVDGTLIISSGGEVRVL